MRQQLTPADGRIIHDSLYPVLDPNGPPLRAIVAGLQWGAPGAWDLEDSLDELAGLAATAGLEVVGRIAGLLDSSVQPLYGSLADRPAEQRRVADLAGAQALLGWTPRTSLTDGLKQTVAWYRQELQAASGHPGPD